MGIARVEEYLLRYGFGQPSGIDLAGETSGILPSPAWKLKNRRERWYPGDTVNISIGQGDWKVTPLQMVRATGAIADAGQMHRPHLVDARRDRFDAAWTPLEQPVPSLISERPDNVKVVQEGMVMTVHGPGGTARPIGVGTPYRIAGKTGPARGVSRRGTAAVNPRSLPMHLRHRALFVGYAPADDPQIVVAVAVEGGGYGGSTAAPIARKIFDAWLLGKLPDGLEPIDGMAPAATCAAGDAACVAAVAAAETPDARAKAAAGPSEAIATPPPPSRGMIVAGDRDPSPNAFGSWARQHGFVDLPTSSPGTPGSGAVHVPPAAAPAQAPAADVPAPAQPAAPAAVEPSTDDGAVR